MKKYVLWLILIFFLPPNLAFSEGVSATFDVNPGEWLEITVYRLDNKVHIDMYAYENTFALMEDVVIRQDGWEYDIISDYLFKDENGESFFSLSYGDSVCATIEPGFDEGSNLDLSKEFDIVNAARTDKPFITIPAEKSSSGGCFISELK